MRYLLCVWLTAHQPPSTGGTELCLRETLRKSELVVTYSLMMELSGENLGLSSRPYECLIYEMVASLDNSSRVSLVQNL